MEKVVKTLRNINDGTRQVHVRRVIPWPQLSNFGAVRIVNFRVIHSVQTASMIKK